MDEKRVRLWLVPFLLTLALIACDLTPLQNALDDAIQKAIDNAVQQTKETITKTVKQETDNFAARTVRWINEKVNYVCRLAVLDEKICKDTVGWVYADPLIGSMDKLGASKDILELIGGATPTVGSLALDTLLVYPEISACVTKRQELGFAPCGEAGLSLLAIAGIAAIPLLGIPVLAGAAIFGGATALKLILFRN